LADGRDRVRRLDGEIEAGLGVNARGLPRRTCHRSISSESSDCASAPVFIWFWGGRPGRMMYGFPALPRASSVKVATEQSTPGYRFLIDRHPEMDRVMVVSACSGHGFEHSAAVGEAIVEEIAEGRSTLELSPFRAG
jgi:hypothetical protein